MPEHAIQYDQNAQPGRAHESKGCYDASARVYTFGADWMLEILDFLLMFTICTNVHGYATDGRRNHGGTRVPLNLPGG